MNIVGVSHVGITVGDLDRSVDFYCSMFGLTEVKRGDLAGEVVALGVGVPRAEMRVALLTGHGLLLELIQYVRSKGSQLVGANNDIGAMHVCFSVTDIDDVHARLSARGVAFLAPPSPPNENGIRWAFLNDPDGIRVEILEADLSRAAS